MLLSICKYCDLFYFWYCLVKVNKLGFFLNKYFILKLCELALLCTGIFLIYYKNV